MLCKQRTKKRENIQNSNRVCANRFELFIHSIFPSFFLVCFHQNDDEISDQNTRNSDYYDYQ